MPTRYKGAVLVVAVAILLQHAGAQSEQSDKEKDAHTVRVLNINQAFRAKAEDLVDCLDELRALRFKPDGVYAPQEVKCLDMVKKVRREASTTDERKLALDLLDLQTAGSTCRLILTGTSRHKGDVDQCTIAEDAQRILVIKEGSLRFP